LARIKTVNIVNLTRDKLLLEDAMVADTMFARMKGLIGRSGLESGQGMVLKPANSVHTFGMKFAIDVAFIDRRGRVLRLLKEMVPGRLGPIVLGSVCVVEAAAGEFAKAGLKEGDLLSFGA